ADNKRAADEFRKAMAADPKYAEAHFNLGLSYYRLGKTIDATKEFEAALKLEPRASGPYVQLGNLYLQQGKRDRAVEAFKKAVESTKDDRKKNPDAYRGLAMAYLGLGKIAEAVDTLKTAVKEMPNEPSAHEALGDALLASGDADGAVAEFKKRLELAPTNEGRLDLARAYAKKRVAAEARPLFEAGVEDDPKRRDA